MRSVIELERVIKVGDSHVAALVQRDLVRHHYRNSLSVWFTKRSLAILIKDGLGTRALDPEDGTTILREEVERLSPGAMETFIRQTL